ncbi:hypothetical protein [Brunnivagina elsteri]|uniref:Uncharacterized protein n=1 Tax=Brunnivagina elsteri CCALA 953 TaxID=987040 RepID=A0A2A2TPI6_9CYAN|nr:hypothetical protein [Calothrix elsteri]PAX60327.1 hypothetical protein CK510_02480 [Calothrix elsteri CCALA 953]
MTYQIESEPSPKRRSAIQSIWDVGVIVSLVILALSAQNGNFNQPTASSPLKPIHASEVANNSNNFRGKTVTIASKPIGQIGTNSFILKDGFFSQQEPVLVVNASGVPFKLPSDKRSLMPEAYRNVEIQVTGKVRNFSISEIERDYNLNLQAEQYRDYVNKPVVVAEDIILAPQPNQIADNPKSYYGQTVAVTGKVGDITSPILMTLHQQRIFRDMPLALSSAYRDLPVLLTSELKTPINKGQKVAVVGEVRPFIASEIEQQYNLNWDSDVKREMEAKYRNQPILVAETVYP